MKYSTIKCDQCKQEWVDSDQCYPPKKFISIPFSETTQFGFPISTVEKDFCSEKCLRDFLNERSKV